MIRTDAPKDLEGRGVVNFARTTPEFPVPVDMIRLASHYARYRGRRAYHVAG